MIDSYSFGEIVINGRRYTSDVIIFSNSVDDNWWRKNGHLLHKDDLKDIISEEPEILIVGTGHDGLMKVLDETKQYIESQGIELIIEETEIACKIYNKLEGKKKIIAAFHLTC